MMTGPKTIYALVEGSRGCPHRCTFCSQWKHWQGTYRSKSPKRIADEFEFLCKNFGAEFLWLTDDNFPLGPFADKLCDEIVDRGIAEDIMWFVQARCDDVVRHSNNIDPDLAIFMLLTPFPGTDVYEEARGNRWIEDSNWANYDMVHAIMPTETLSREELQEELVNCYRAFYDSWGRRLGGIFSSNKLKRRTYRYMASQSVLTQLKP
jgi:radical SAM superfamily enzyme YgiQ (UPF0313 family)